MAPVLSKTYVKPAMGQLRFIVVAAIVWIFSKDLVLKTFSPCCQCNIVPDSRPSKSSSKAKAPHCGFSPCIATSLM
eukprot:s1406_g4.t1